jgi:hypothetical protein
MLVHEARGGEIREPFPLSKAIEFDCSRMPHYFLGGNVTGEKTTKDFTLTFEVTFSENRERHLPLPGSELVIRYNTKTGKLSINGNQCKRIDNAATNP